MSSLQDSTKIFWYDKKNCQEPPVTIKLGVKRNKNGRIIFSWKKKKQQKYSCRKTHKNSVRSSERGVALEKEEDGEHSALTELIQSKCLQSELFFLTVICLFYIIGHEILWTRPWSIQVIMLKKKVARFQLNSSGSSRPRAAGNVCTTYTATAGLHRVVIVMNFDGNHDSNKGDIGFTT